MNKEEAITYQCLEEGCLRPENTASAQPKGMNELSMSEEGESSVVGQRKKEEN